MISVHPPRIRVAGVFQQVERHVISPVEVLEDRRRRSLVGEPLEKSPDGVLHLDGLPRLRPLQTRKPMTEQGAVVASSARRDLLAAQEERRHERFQLGAGGVPRGAGEDARSLPDYLRDDVIRSLLLIGRAPTEEHPSTDLCYLRTQFRRQSRFPDAGRSR